jgi:hypothetical protein
MDYFTPAPLTEGERVREFYSLGYSETDEQLLVKLTSLETRLNANLRSRELAPGVRKAVRALLKSGAEWVGTGTSRVCFSYPGSGTVIKVPFCAEGQEASFNEAQAFKNFQKYPNICTPIADCSFVDFTASLGMELLVMERLFEFPTVRIALPDWVNSVDCGQVGYNSQKRLVAYDL